jgi:hypothetical protein
LPATESFEGAAGTASARHRLRVDISERQAALLRRNFAYDGTWRGQRYATKQVEAYAVEEGGDWLVITVMVKFFGQAGA